MTREEAQERGLESFVKPVLGGSTAFPKNGKPVVRDAPTRKVLLIASARDAQEYPALRAYLGEIAPKVATVRVAPIAATYVGAPRFVANPDGLVVTNSLFTVTPRQSMTAEDILTLVERLNAAAARLSSSQFAGRYSPRTLEALEI